MKVYEIMMFLLIFNVAITIVGALNIYNMGDMGRDIDDFASERGEGAIWLLLGQSAVALFTGTVAGGVIGYYVTRIPTTEGMAYGFFAALIAVIFVNSYSVLFAITATFMNPEVRFIANVMVGLFLSICGILFAWGYVQLARGGISGYV